MEAEQQQLPRAALERMEPRPQQVVGDVVVEGPLGRAHAVLEELGAATDERLVEKLLGLTAQRALNDGPESAPEFPGLFRGDPAAVAAGAEDVLEHRLRTEQRARRIDVLDESPQLGERVLDWRRRQQHDRRCPDDLAHPVRGPREPAVLVVNARAVESAVDAREDLMSFVDQAEIEGWRPAQAFEPRAGADVLAPGEEDAGGSDVDVRVRRLDGLDAEQRVELVLPLSQQRARNDDEDPRGPFRQQLGDDEAGFDGLAQPDFVGEDAASFRDAAQREHDRIDLVRVGVDAPAALRRHLPPAFAGGPKAYQFFRVVATVNGVHGTRLSRRVSNHAAGAPQVVAGHSRAPRPTRS